MKRIIRLTERDLSRIVRRVIMEQSTDLKIQFNEFPQVVQNFITENGLNQNNFEWGNATKGAVNYKMANGQYMGLDKMSDFESKINTYNQLKPNMAKCNERSTRWNELSKSLNIKDPEGRKKAETTLNSEFPNMGGCGVALIIQKLINNK